MQGKRAGYMYRGLADIISLQQSWCILYIIEMQKDCWPNNTHDHPFWHDLLLNWMYAWVFCNQCSYVKIISNNFFDHYPGIRSICMLFLQDTYKILTRYLQDTYKHTVPSDIFCAQSNWFVSNSVTHLVNLFAIAQRCQHGPNSVMGYVRLISLQY